LHPLLSVAAAVALAAVGAAPSPVSAPAAPAAPAPPDQGGPPAPAAPQRLAVLPLDAPSELLLVARGLSEAIAQEAAKAPGVEVAAPAQVVAKLGSDGAAAASQCGDSVSCLASASIRLGVDRIVGGRLDREGANYRFRLVLVEAAGGTVVARAAREVPIASRRIRADAVAAAGPLLRGEAAGVGVLAVLTEDPGAEVRIDDAAAGRTPFEARLPAGKHKLEVAQRGKVKLDAFWVDVPAGGRTEQRVRLFDIPATQRKPGEVETVVDVGKDKKRKR
jgi:hypothetical protein